MGDEYKDDEDHLRNTKDDLEDDTNDDENDEDELANIQDSLEDAENMNIEGTNNVDQVSYTTLFTVFNKDNFINLINY